ncbi:MAG: peptide chain release factor N(5)-glutamine methyltransferase [SAR202 cluster bacterium]|nr:peptide chain release factor N(5)-glutamine methyltransferase [SAR202 cluster bacterium]
MKSGSPDSRLEAEILLRHVLKIDRATMFSNLENILDSKQENDIAELVQRRLANEPLSYITGTREFYSLDFQITSAVLIPRQETETLVDEVIKIAKENPLKIVDVGTGSGAIAIALAVNLPLAKIIATDISVDALHVAESNTKMNDVFSRINLKQGNLLDVLDEKVDVIVSNPPYIPSNQIEHLQPEVKKEPHIALDGGSDGLEYIRKLIGNCSEKLNNNGHIFIEIDPSQSEEVLKIADTHFPDARTAIIKDLSQNNRVLSIHLT